MIFNELRVLAAKLPFSWLCREKRAPKATGISKRLLPILRTASQLLGQNFPRANDPAGNASYLEPFGSHFELELKFQWEISKTQNLKFAFV